MKPAAAAGGRHWKRQAHATKGCVLPSTIAAGRDGICPVVLVQRRVIPSGVVCGYAKIAVCNRTITGGVVADQQLPSVGTGRLVEHWGRMRGEGATSDQSMIAVSRQGSASLQDRNGCRPPRSPFVLRSH